jgi:hypothetical protein
MCAQARVESLNPQIRAENDYAIVDPDINKCIGNLPRDNPRRAKAAVVPPDTEPAPPPNSGRASSLEEAKAAFKRRSAEVKGRT